MSETITPALRAYLTDWLAWAEAGAPEHAGFSPHRGLCDDAPSDVVCDLREALEADFGALAVPFATCTPFDTPDREYWRDSAAGTHHTNPLRLAWVRAQLAKPTGA